MRYQNLQVLQFIVVRNLDEIEENVVFEMPPREEFPLLFPISIYKEKMKEDNNNVGGAPNENQQQIPSEIAPKPLKFPKVNFVPPISKYLLDKSFNEDEDEDEDVPLDDGKTGNKKKKKSF